MKLFTGSAKFGRVVRLIAANWPVAMLVAAAATLPFSGDYLPTQHNIHRIMTSKIAAMQAYYREKKYPDALGVADLLAKSEFPDIRKEALIHKAMCLYELARQDRISSSYLEIDVPNLLVRYTSEFSVDQNARKLYGDLLGYFARTGLAENITMFLGDGITKGVFSPEYIKDFVLRLLVQIDADSDVAPAILEQIGSIALKALELAGEEHKAPLIRAYIAVLGRKGDSDGVLKFAREYARYITKSPELYLITPVIMQANKKITGKYGLPFEVPAELGEVIREQVTLLANKEGVRPSNYDSLDVKHPLNKYVKHGLLLKGGYANADVLKFLDNGLLFEVIMNSYVLDMEDVSKIVHFVVKAAKEQEELKAILAAVDKVLESITQHHLLLQQKAEILRKLGKYDDAYTINSADIYVKMSMLKGVGKAQRRRWFEDAVRVLAEGGYAIRGDEMYDRSSYLFSVPLAEKKWNHAKLMLLEGVYTSAIAAAASYMKGKDVTNPLVPELVLEVSKINLLLGNVEKAVAGDKERGLRGIDDITLLGYRLSPLQRSILNPRKILYAEVLFQRALAGIELLRRQTDQAEKFKTMIKTRSLLSEYIERYTGYYGDKDVDLYIITANKLLAELSIEDKDYDKTLEYIGIAEKQRPAGLKIEKDSHTDLLLLKSYVLHLKGDYKASLAYADKAKTSAADPARKMLASLLSAKAGIGLGKHNRDDVAKSIAEIEEFLEKYKDSVMEEFRSFLMSEKDIIKIAYEKR